MGVAGVGPVCVGMKAPKSVETRKHPCSKTGDDNSVQNHRIVFCTSLIDHIYVHMRTSTYVASCMQFL